jgi:cytidylate kinase
MMGTTQGFTVAIDGPAASGKGTISKAVAEYFGFAHLDTGLLYRAVGAKVLLGVEPEAAAKALLPADLEGEGLRGAQVAQEASKVAALPEVRAALVDFQRSFAARAGGAVLDGVILVRSFAPMRRSSCMWLPMPWCAQGGGLRN